MTTSFDEATTTAIDDITGDYTLDVSHSRLGFVARHAMVTKVRGQFGAFSGTATIDEATPASSKVDLTIDVTSIDTGNADRDGHLKSPDFFDAEKYPTITFKSTKVEAAGDKKLRVIGDLTIKGVTKQVVLDTTINKVGEQPMAKRAAAGFDATTTIKRSDFGVDKYAPNVSDNVTLRITTEAVVPKK